MRQNQCWPTNHRTSKPAAASPTARTMPPRVCMLALIAELSFVGLDVAEDDPDEEDVFAFVPELVPVEEEPAAPVVDPPTTVPSAEGSFEIVAHVPPLVVPLGSYARNATFPVDDSCTSALVDALYVANGSCCGGPVSVFVVFVSTLITYVALPSSGMYANSCCTPSSKKNDAALPCVDGNAVP